MLTALHLGNFKAFAELQNIPLRPLTLIYGANSAGKSSIIQSLVLARNAMETGDLDVHRTTVGGDSVDLGGFRQYVHRREAKRRVEWSVDLDAAKFRGNLVEFFAAVRTVTMTVSIGVDLDDQDRPRPESGPTVHTYEIKADGHSVLRMSRRRDGTLRLDRLDHEHPVFREAIKAMVLLSSTTEELHPEDFEGLDEAVTALVPDIIASGSRFLPDGLAKSDIYAPSAQPALFTISKGRRREDLAAALRSFLPRKLHELLKGVSEVVSAELARLQYLGPLRSYPPRHMAFSQHHDPNWYAGGGYAWDVVRRDARVRGLVNEWLGSAERLQTPYELVVRELVPDYILEDNVPEKLNRSLYDLLLKFLRESPEGGGQGDSIGIVADELLRDSKPDSDELVPSIQQVVSRLENSEQTVRQWVASLLSERSEPLQDPVLVDKRTKAAVTHRDVGIGISQVLPVLVGAFSAENRLIAVEQPEIHLHPKLQAELGDVFISASLGPQANEFILETHSEHLLLRIMKRMRQTAEKKLPEGIPAVRPEDVMVLFVEPDGGRSIVREMPLNERGELVKAWPGGFFEEGLREVF